MCGECQSEELSDEEVEMGWCQNLARGRNFVI